MTSGTNFKGGLRNQPLFLGDNNGTAFAAALRCVALTVFAYRIADYGGGVVGRCPGIWVGIWFSSLFVFSVYKEKRVHCMVWVADNVV